MTFLILVESVSCQWLASAASVGLANAGPYKALIPDRQTRRSFHNRCAKNAAVAPRTKKTAGSLRQLDHWPIPLSLHCIGECDVSLVGSLWNSGVLEPLCGEGSDSLVDSLSVVYG